MAILQYLRIGRRYFTDIFDPILSHEPLNVLGAAKNRASDLVN